MRWWLMCAFLFVIALLNVAIGAWAGLSVYRVWSSADIVFLVFGNTCLVACAADYSVVLARKLEKE